MNHKTFLRKLALKERLDDQLRDVVIDVVAKYRAAGYNCQKRWDTWVWNNDHITIVDTSYGDYYDTDIPMRYFEDFEAAVKADKEKEAELERQKAQKDAEIRERIRVCKEQEERETYLRLKAKYEQTDDVWAGTDL